MYEASRAMLASVTSYVASPDETKRGSSPRRPRAATAHHALHHLLETAKARGSID
jgi:hypothetical protein